MVNKNVCEEMIKNNLNELMDNLKVQFIKVGYEPVKFDTFDSNHVHIIKMDYVFVSPVKKGEDW